jgi:hypothetical protein
LAPQLLLERLEQVAQALSFFDFDAAQQAVSSAVANVDNPRALYEAGYELIEIGLDQFAVAPLAQALVLHPSLDILWELCTALARSWCFREAADLLASHPEVLEGSSLFSALYAHYAAMTGDFEAVAAILPRLESDEQSAPLVAAAYHRYGRYETLAEVGHPIENDLRDWELVLHGMVVLHVSTDGAEVMNGRYGALWESSETYGSILAVLVALLTSQGKEIKAVAYTPERDSEILAKTLTSHLGLPAPKSITDSAPTAGTLVVAYRWPGSAPEALATWCDAPDVVLYGHVLDWIHDYEFAPDVAGYEAQFVWSPWDEQLRLKPGADGVADGANEVEDIPPDSRPAGDIAADLAAKINLDDATRSELADIQFLLDALQQSDANYGLLTGEHQQFHAGGPVSSNRFP